jgi:ganglioside GM2 activator
MFEIFLPDGHLLFRKELPVCDYIKREVMIWPKLEKASNLPKNKPCPLPKGNYTIENFVIDDSGFGPLPYGKYIAKGKLLEDRKILTQIDIVAWMNK